MKEIDLVKALYALNKQTLVWLSFFLEAYGALNHRKTFIRLFLQHEKSQSDFLREKILLDQLLVDTSNITVVEAISKVLDASYPLFAEREVLTMKASSTSVSSFPSIELYEGAVKTLQGTILTTKEALFESVETFAAHSSNVAIMLHARCKTSENDNFSDKDLAESIDSDKAAESKAVEVIVSYLDPHIERLEGLLILAEKIKDEQRSTMS